MHLCWFSPNVKITCNTESVQCLKGRLTLQGECLGAGRILRRVSLRQVVERKHHHSGSRGVWRSAEFRYLPTKWGRRSYFSSWAWLLVQRQDQQVTPRFRVQTTQSQSNLYLQWEQQVDKSFLRNLCGDKNTFSEFKPYIFWKLMISTIKNTLMRLNLFFFQVFPQVHAFPLPSCLQSVQTWSRWGQCHQASSPASTSTLLSPSPPSPLPSSSPSSLYSQRSHGVHALVIWAAPMQRANTWTAWEIPWITASMPNQKKCKQITWLILI